MFGQYREEPPAEQDITPRKGLGDLLRSKPAWELLLIGAPLLGVTLFLHVYLASQRLNCRTSTTTSCVVTHHAVFGLVPVGREEIADLACIA